MLPPLLTVVSYNLHGFNQGSVGIKELMCKIQPDIIMTQEHWLTPDNLWKMNTLSDNYFVFGSSAMCASLAAGPLRGRPFGGTAILVNKKHISYAENIMSHDRFTVVKINNVLLITVYLPCVNTSQRDILYTDLLCELQGVIESYPTCDYLIGGDFNTDLDAADRFSLVVNEFINYNNLCRCDQIIHVADRNTYVNETTKVYSAIDYILSSNSINVVAFNIIDLDINLSDHCPVMTVCKHDVSSVSQSAASYQSHDSKPAKTVYLRWDHAPLNLYYEHTRVLLQPILDNLDILQSSLSILTESTIINVLDSVYENVVLALCQSANLFVPKHTKDFYKFWWSQELDLLKSNAIASCTEWKNAGKPRGGNIYLQYRHDKLLYKKRLREEQRTETICYSNDLHEALLRKSGQDFWKTWKYKFESSRNTLMQVDGVTDNALVADKFAKYFEKVCSPLNEERNNVIKSKYSELRSQYNGTPINDKQWFDVELVSKLIGNMANGKAPGLDELSIEHIKYSHPIVVCILAKLFNLFLTYSHIPPGFGRSYTVPIPKCDSRARALSASDFRGISISPVISKLFETAILDKFSMYFVTSDHQFGFKKKVSCRHAIFCVRNVIESFVNNGSTVNVCTIDLSKAFDRMNHHALFIKLMERKLPVELLTIMETWFSISTSCVKWNSTYSDFFTLLAGVRQGGVLSPYLFAVFLDDMVYKVMRTNLGCYLSSICAGIFLYADDILLLAPTVAGLERLLHVCEHELEQLDMSINVSKTSCIRFGPRFNVQCAELISLHGDVLIWANQCRYLGVYFSTGRTLKCSFSNAKSRFYRAFNTLFSKIGRNASEETVLELIRAKCLPVLLYATEACPMLSRDKQSLDFCMNRLFMKIFRTGSLAVVRECQRFLNFLPVESLLTIRTAKFLQVFTASENNLCYMFKSCALIQLNEILCKFGVRTAQQLKSKVCETFITG